MRPILVLLVTALTMLVEQDLLAHRAWIGLVPHPPQVNPVVTSS
jgi:hypothetical protein